MNPLIMALVVVALGRVALGGLAVWNGATPYQYVQMGIAVEFAAVGAFLYFWSLGDVRTQAFGLVLILCASPWPRDVLESATGAVTWVAHVAGRLRPDSFLPAAVWRFARLYPFTPSVLDVKVRVGSHVALVTSVTLGIGTLVRGFEGTWFWPLNMAMSSAGLLALANRFRHSPSSHDRRGRLLAVGFTVAALPIAVHTLLDAFVPQFRAATDPGQPAYVVSAVGVVGGLALAPLMTAYAVAVHQALVLQLTLRAATRRWVGRAAIAATWLLPLALTVGLAFWLRGLSISDLFDGWRLGALALVAVAWSLAAWVRRLFRSDLGLDRPLEHSQTLLEMAKEVRQVVDLDQLDAVVSTHTARLLDVEHATLLSCAGDGVLFAPSGAMRPLTSAALSRIQAAPANAFDLGDAGVSASLVPADRAWLVDGNVFGLLPLQAAGNDQWLGAIAVGPRTNGAPFSEEQQIRARAAAQLVEAVAQRIGDGRIPVAPAYVPTEPGAACTRCGSVMGATVATCSCGGNLEPAPPPIVAGLYRLVRRLGRGSYGVAYEAVDLELERPVVIKASHAVDLTTAARIRREARHMAQLRHPAVATVFGLEFWSGRPLLVMEFLSRGTLAERRGGLTAADWESMATSLADGLRYAHECGIAHGDIASRNIGFDESGRAKLIDFGLAAHDAGPDRYERDAKALCSTLRECRPASLPESQFERAMDDVVRMLAARASVPVGSHV